MVNLIFGLLYADDAESADIRPWLSLIRFALLYCSEIVIRWITSIERYKTASEMDIEIALNSIFNDCCQ